MITYQMILDRLNRSKVYPSVSYWDMMAEKNYGSNGTLLYKNPYINEIYHNVEEGIISSWAVNVAERDILDIGCGAGRYCREFADRGARVHGIDFSSKSIEVARQLSLQPSIRYSIGSIYDLNDTNVYDLVICSRVLAIACRSQEDALICVSRIYAALKPGGRAIFIEPMHRSFMRRVLKMNLAEFKITLTSSGFEVLDVREAEFYPARMFLAYFQFSRCVTRTLFSWGEVVSRMFPKTADQKFVLTRRL